MSADARADDATDVSVLVVTHNNRDLVEPCLDAITASEGVGEPQVIVVDNASTDGTRELLAARPVEVLALESNVGFARAVNAGWQRANGRYVALVNSDAFVDRGCLRELVRALDERPRAGIVGARLRYASGRHQPSAGTFPSLLGSLWVALFLHRVPGLARAGVGYLAAPSLYVRPRRVDWVSAAVCAARAQLGPLPDSRFMYGEDVEWAAALKGAGWDVWLEPSATAVHLSAASVAESQPAGFAQRRRARFELDWCARRGALARVLVFGTAGALRGRRDARVSEYLVLLRAALAPRGRIS